MHGWIFFYLREIRFSYCLCCALACVPVRFYTAEAFPRSTIAAPDYVSHRSTTNRLSAFSATLQINLNGRLIASIFYRQSGFGPYDQCHYSAVTC
jgi:hypothetical protein